MTERTAFENPPISSARLSASDFQKILTLQGEILQRAVTSSEYGKLLDEMCLLVESFTPNAVVALMLYDSERKQLFVENAPSLGPDAIEAFNGLRSGVGSCGNAVYHNEAMYVCNTLDDPRWNELTDVANRFNICSCFSFPVLDADGEAIGSFSISSFEPRTPSGFHRALLETCTSICGVILQRRDADDLRKRMLDEQIKTERIESVGILAGGIAHDFNNLLMSVLGNVDLTQRLMPDGDEKESLQLAMKAIERASELTRRLLTLAKGQSPIREPNNIGTIIRDSAEFALHGSNVSFELTGVERLNSPLVSVDGGQIGQLMQNLVINARQAMPQGGVVSIHCVEQELSHHSTLREGRYVRISVTDNGEGMTSEQLGRIFDPYYTTRDHGSGLGLFLCYSIASGHGGHIQVESELGTGTCFTVYLPIDSEEIASAVEEGDDNTPLSARVLIMDDDPLVRRTLSRILTVIGCKVWEAAEGLEAIDLFRRLQRDQQNIEVFILDLTVPGGMGGADAMREIRRIDSTAKIIVSTGYSFGTDETDGLAGFDATLLKPYNIAELKRVIRDLLVDR